MRTTFSILILLISLTTLAQNKYAEEWQQIDSLTAQGKSQSALEHIIRIYDQAKAANQADQFVKASLCRMAVESSFQEDYYEKNIQRTLSEIQTAKAPVKQILHSIVAELYWKYYQQHRWEIGQRSVTSNFLPDDLKTWDLRKIVAACMDNYASALTEKELLKTTPLSAYTEILIKQEESEKFRPTLFDFLAHRAIDFYSSSDAGLTKPAESFLVDQPAYFAAVTQFATQAISSPDAFSFEFQSIKLFQEVLRLHQNDADPTALIDADLERLSFVHQKSTLPEKDSLYMKALTRLENQFQNHSSSTEIAYKIALQLSADDQQPTHYRNKNAAVTDIPEGSKWNKKKAIEICEAAIRRFPDSFGANNCRSLIEQIKQPSLSITTEYASIAGKPSRVLVNYQNISKVYFRLLKIDYEENREILENDRNIRLGKYRDKKAELSWEQELPDDGDCRSYSVEVKIPAQAFGHYVLLASSDASFPTKSACVSSSDIWISDISYLCKKDKQNDEITVLHRESGQPLAGVKVQVFYQNYNSSSRKYNYITGDTFVSNQDGIVSIPPSSKNIQKDRPFRMTFQTKEDQLITEDIYSWNSYSEEKPKPIILTQFFTDRAIYRPGQTIYFKGIVLEKEGGKVSIQPGIYTDIILYDTNNKVISKQTLLTNDFGSFSGSFIAPQGVLNGNMRIWSKHGEVSVRVEEYKRPKFEVSFEPVKGSYKLGESVSVKGKAAAYAGSTISDAKVQYRVVRQAHFPYWWGWRNSPNSADMEITHGETQTGNDGLFTVNFTAIPDLSVDRKTDPYFSYTVYADVTDSNGETHSSETSVSVGYKALLVTTNLTDEVNLEKGFGFSLTTTNLNNEKEKASGKIAIYKLQKPESVLFARKWEKPDRFVLTKEEFQKEFPGEVYSDEDDVSTWPKGNPVFTADFNTPADSLIKSNNLKPGMYQLEIKTNDAFGEEVTYTKAFQAFLPQSSQTEAISPVFFNLLSPTVEPGQDLQFVVATPLRKATVSYEIVQGEKILRREVLRLSNEQRLIRIPVTEKFRGNVFINLAMVRNNRSFTLSQRVKIPYSNKKLDIQFASFRNKLQPGQEEEWQITLRDNKGEKVLAELLAGMYDASLDAFVPHEWYFSTLNSYYDNQSWINNQCFRFITEYQYFYPEAKYSPKDHLYDQLYWFNFGNRYSGGRMLKSGNIMIRGFSQDKASIMTVAEDTVSAPSSIIDESTMNSLMARGGKSNNSIANSSIQIRKNLNETAFFYPQLATNENGEVVLKFKAPESLTRWKMMGLAYTKDLKYGQIEKTLVTQKDLMIFTNAPRFLREGDRMQFAAKITNISDHDLTGTAELHFFDARSMKPIDDLLELNVTKIAFSANKGLSTPVSWEIHIPEGLQAVTYRITATAGDFSDGEEAAIPVLTNRMLVTESMPLPINGMQQKNFSFDKLVNSGTGSSSLRNYRLTLEFTSNPAWYAVQALPYLMEFPHECAEQLFSRYYANSLATHIANSDPKIKRVFESWKNSSPDALKSNLEKNEELKSVLLQESPWVREATSDSERKQRLGLLFDLNKMASEQTEAMKKLRDRQAPNGGWPWFAGMPESRYITQHIVAGLGHLQVLNVLNPLDKSEISEMLKKAINYLDETVNTEFERLKKDDKDYPKPDHLSYDDIQYLYARSYFTSAFPIDAKYNEMIGYYQSQSVKYWKSQNNYLKAMMALYLNRMNNKQTASVIMRSLKENALYSDEMGMYWRNEQPGWFWHQAPVETQALLIEAFDEVSHDQKSVEEMMIWLLKQKQTQDWKTTKATTEAIYALLLHGSSLLASDKLVEITVGSEKVDPYKQDTQKPEAGTGYFKTSWDAASIKPEMGKVTVNNPNPTIAWGAMYWQYFEQLDKITPAQTPLSLNKKLFREVNTSAGPVIEPITDKSPIKVGDKIVVRIELRADRTMEYIHLKDMRASAFEPVNVLSGYHYQDGLGYYESTLDASTNFFISYLPKGTYVFEYKLTATQKGEFSNGITSIQCMYAPEFAAHSEGIRVKVE